MSGGSRRGSAPSQPLVEAVEGSAVVVDRIDRDTIALAELLAARDARVTLLDTYRARDADDDPLRGLRALGIQVASAMDGAAIDACDVFFAHDYSAPSSPAIRAARASGCRVVHLADLLLELSPALSIGVTGSAGKSTTSAMIGAILGASGRPVYMPRSHVLSGSANPNWELLNDPGRMRSDGTLILELTSSHLEYMARSPRVAVVTTVTPDHVEWHGSLEAYVAAKRRIVEHQSAGDHAVLNADEATTRAWADAAPGTVHLFSLEDRPDAQVRVSGSYVVAGPDAEIVMRRDELDASGGYPVNVLAAATAALAAGASPDDVRSGLRGFRRLRHRRERIALGDGVEVVDDGLALTPRKAMASLGTARDGRVILICGGAEELDGWSVAPMHSSPEELRVLDTFARLAATKARQVVTFGRAGRRLREVLERNGFPPARVTDVPALADAAREAIRVARRGDTVLLAPVFDPGERELEAFPDVVREALNARSVRT